MCVYVGVQLLASQVIFNYTVTIYKFVHCLVEEGVWKKWFSGAHFLRDNDTSAELNR